MTSNPTNVTGQPGDRYLLQTVRSYDQFNSTGYGLDDRYRGVTDRRQRGLRDGDLVDIVSEGAGDGERRASSLRVAKYSVRRGFQHPGT